MRNTSGEVPIRVWLKEKGRDNIAQMWINIYQYKKFSMSDEPEEALLTPPDTKVKLLTTGTGIRLSHPHFETPFKMDHAYAVLENKGSYMAMLNSEAFPLSTVKFCGRKWPAPKIFAKALQTAYGTHWRTPQFPDGT